MLSKVLKIRNREYCFFVIYNIFSRVELRATSRELMSGLLIVDSDIRPTISANGPQSGIGQTRFPPSLSPAMGHNYRRYTCFTLAAFEVRMTRPKLAAALLLFILTSVVAAQNAPQNSPLEPPQQLQDKPPEPCTVSGRVVSAADGMPLRSAHVGLVEHEEKRHPAVYAAITDGDGRFKLEKVPPGHYEFYAARTGFISQQYQEKGSGEGGATLSLSPGQVVDDAMFRLAPAAVISGRVVDEAGEPMMGVYVAAMRRPTKEEREKWNQRSKRERLMESGSVVTDDRGEYRLFGLKAGEYYIKAAEAPDEAYERRGNAMQWDDHELEREIAARYAPLYYPGVVQLGQAQAVQLRAGEEMQADFEMRHIKTVQISGHVIGADGKPAVRTYVSLMAADEDYSGSQLGEAVDTKGEFTIKGVPPGSYTIHAGQMIEGKRYTTRQKIEVGEANIENVVLSFNSGVNIKGRITATASGIVLQRTHVWLRPLDDDAGNNFAEVKSDGTFELNNIGDGNYILRAGGEIGWYMKSARLGATDAIQNGIQIERGTAPGSLEIVLSNDAAQLDGAVTQDSKPVVGASIRVEPDPETPYNEHRTRHGSTDQNGQFSIQTIPPGKYKVIAKLPSESPETPALASEPQTITLGERDHQTLRVELPEAKEQ
jgi:protocatechuate 3,4-dioxygenase beta subunit